MRNTSALDYRRINPTELLTTGTRPPHFLCFAEVALKPVPSSFHGRLGYGFNRSAPPGTLRRQASYLHPPLLVAVFLTRRRRLPQTLSAIVRVRGGVAAPAPHAGQYPQVLNGSVAARKPHKSVVRNFSIVRLDSDENKGGILNR
jgi:hypothetical protein